MSGQTPANGRRQARLIDPGHALRRLHGAYVLLWLKRSEQAHFWPTDAQRMLAGVHHVKLSWPQVNDMLRAMVEHKLLSYDPLKGYSVNELLE